MEEPEIETGTTPGSAEKDEAIPGTVPVHFIKSNLFRVVHADGFWGGATPHGKIQLIPFNERNAIPQRLLLHDVEGVARERPGSRVGRKGIVRELEVDVLMDLNTAISLRDFLDQQIKQLQGILVAVEANEEAKEL